MYGDFQSISQSTENQFFDFFVDWDRLRPKGGASWARRLAIPSTGIVDWRAALNVDWEPVHPFYFFGGQLGRPQFS